MMSRRSKKDRSAEDRGPRAEPTPGPDGDGRFRGGAPSDDSEPDVSPTTHSPAKASKDGGPAGTEVGPAGRSEPEEGGEAPDLTAIYLDQLQRLKAEFDNYRRRVAREREEWFLDSRAEVLRQLLPVLDDLRRAREHNRTPGEAPDAAGLLLILKRFEETVAQLGLEEQDASPGTEFDPERHEAVLATASEEIPEGRIVQAMDPGFLLKGRLLRPSKVAVSSGPPAG